MLVRVQPEQPFRARGEIADALVSETRGVIRKSATLFVPTISGASTEQARRDCVLRRLGLNRLVGQDHGAPPLITINERNPMKSVTRFQSQLLFRNGYKANRVIRIRPTPKLNFSFRPVRFGLKPEIIKYECKSD